jgi:hypothetical protein
MRLKAYLVIEMPSLHINCGSVPRDTIVMQCFSGCLMYPQRYHIQIAVSDEGIPPYVNVTQWFFSQTESKLWVLKATANIEKDSKPSRPCLLESLTNLNQPDWSTDWSPTVCQPTIPPKRSHNRHPRAQNSPTTLAANAIDSTDAANITNTAGNANAAVDAAATANNATADVMSQRSQKSNKYQKSQ